MTKPKGPTGPEKARRLSDLRNRIQVLLELLHEAQTEAQLLERTVLKQEV